MQNGTVFVGGRFRLLNPMERTQFQVLLTNPRTVALEVNSASSSRIPLVEDAVDDGQLPSPATKFMGRFRRATLTTAAEAGDSENGRNSENGGKKGGGPVEVDLVGLLSHFLDVNTTIVERLMPVLEASPLIRQITNAAPEASEGGEEDVKNKGKNNTMGNEQISGSAKN